MIGKDGLEYRALKRNNHTCDMEYCREPPAVIVAETITVCRNHYIEVYQGVRSGPDIAELREEIGWKD